MYIVNSFGWQPIFNLWWEFRGFVYIGIGERLDAAMHPFVIQNRAYHYPIGYAKTVFLFPPISSNYVVIANNDRPTRAWCNYLSTIGEGLEGFHLSFEYCVLSSHVDIGMYGVEKCVLTTLQIYTSYIYSGIIRRYIAYIYMLYRVLTHGAGYCNVHTYGYVYLYTMQIQVISNAKASSERHGKPGKPVNLRELKKRSGKPRDLRE